MTTPTPARPCSSPARPAARDDQQIGGRPSSPSPTGDDHRIGVPTTTNTPPSSSSPGRPHTWHHPNPNHPATNTHAQTIRTHPCTTCGAPPTAACNNHHGHRIDHLHLARCQAADAMEVGR